MEAKPGLLIEIDNESSLSLISSLIDKFNRLDIPCLKLRYFNADSFKKKKIDDILVNFIDEKSPTTLDLLNIQKIDFIYHSVSNFMKVKVSSRPS